LQLQQAAVAIEHKTSPATVMQVLQDLFYFLLQLFVVAAIINIINKF